MPPQPSYDLMVLLDPEVPEDTRAGIVERIKGQIGSGDATLKGDSDWGMRRLAYEIDHRTEAQYHLFQFQAGPDVLNELDRSLSIDDAVLRFRTIRLPGEAPEVPPPAPPHAPPERPRREDRGRDGERGRRDRDSGDRAAPRQTEEAPAPEADAELARAEEATTDAVTEPAADAGVEPATDPGPEPTADADAGETGSEPAAG
jgi:small subunit ribosomal protein S6